MNRFQRVAFTVLSLVTLQGGIGETVAQEALAPPFGLRWGDSPVRLLDWANRTNLEQVVKVPAGQPRLKILMVASPGGSLPGHDATMIEARFLDGVLFEVAVHYTYPGRTAAFVKGKFVELKRTLGTRHGAFQPAGKKRSKDDGILIASEAWRIQAGADGYLLLVQTEVQDAVRGDAAARFSVVYHHGEIGVDNEAPVIIQRGKTGVSRVSDER